MEEIFFNMASKQLSKFDIMLFVFAFAGVAFFQLYLGGVIVSNEMRNGAAYVYLRQNPTKPIEVNIIIYYFYRAMEVLWPLIAIYLVGKGLFLWARKD